MLFNSLNLDSVDLVLSNNFVDMTTGTDWLHSLALAKRPYLRKRPSGTIGRGPSQIPGAGCSGLVRRAERKTRKRFTSQPRQMAMRAAAQQAMPNMASTARG